jgi:hypothetical protein
MNQRNRRDLSGNRSTFLLAICGSSLSIMLAIAGAGAQSNIPKTPAAPAGPKLAEEEFKNIQALKGIPAEQVIPSMHCGFSGSRMRVLPRGACERKGRQKTESNRAQDDQHDDGDQ